MEVLALDRLEADWWPRRREVGAFLSEEEVIMMKGLTRDVIEGIEWQVKKWLGKDDRIAGHLKHRILTMRSASNWKSSRNP